MLIVLPDSLLDEDLTAPTAELSRRALANLGLAHREGKHVLLFSAQFQKRLRQLHPWLGSDVSEIYRPSSVDRDYAAALREQVGVYVEVLGSSPAHELSRAPRVFHVGLNYFSDSLRIQATQLVGEDQRDAEIYTKLARAYASRRSLHLSFRRVAGGGISTGRVFRACGKEGITLCIADTDASAPDAPLKKTAHEARIARDALHADAHVADLELLPCHELENLLPESLIVDAAENHAPSQIRDAVAMHRSSFGRVDHVDLKQLVDKHMIVWVANYIDRLSEQKLAEYCFAVDRHPYLRELGHLLWSWGVCPPRGRLRA